MIICDFIKGWPFLAFEILSLVYVVNSI